MDNEGLDMDIKFQCIDKDAKIPQLSTKWSVGYDLYSVVDKILQPASITKIPLGLTLTMPPWIWAQILSRSSMAFKGIQTCGGVIDPDYDGEINVILHNTTTEAYVVTKGQRIAQMVFHHAVYPVDNNCQTTRGEGGFGSTGE